MNRRNFVKSLFTLSCIPLVPLALSACTVFNPEDRYNLFKNELQSEIQDIIKKYYYEKNTEKTRRSLTSDVEKCVQKFFNDYDIPLYSFQVICDASNNTEETINCNELYLTVVFKLSKSPKMTVLNFKAVTQ